ncbi:DUF948 domain-containing protein [Desemzia sp. RIT804]|uniref:DUF948 domain-containing protein n=1 Tax=Desemzia sp. RIT 804 TaxID=2810209 RepID=UPI00194DCC33|nr:DUF948 domain-containing protein [Desemzia sp. RIT 804]MBM6615841.1 DUF948 domain-containing protein [Desemzia sp. RIT 804]
MSIEFYIAIAIVILAIIGLAVAGVIIKKRITILMNEVNSVVLDVNHTVDRFNNDVNAINSKVANIQNRADMMMKDVADKQQYIHEFTTTTSEFSGSLNQLKASGQDLSNQFISSPAKTTKRTFPSLIKVGKTAKKMVKKRQK